MLRTAFIGQENFFDHRICEWLSEHTDLCLIIWTNKLSWSRGRGKDRIRNVLRRFVKRAQRKGLPRAANELFYYVFYRQFIQEGEAAKLRHVVETFRCRPRKPLGNIP